VDSNTKCNFDKRLVAKDVLVSIASRPAKLLSLEAIELFVQGGAQARDRALAGVSRVDVNFF